MPSGKPEPRNLSAEMDDLTRIVTLEKGVRMPEVKIEIQDWLPQEPWQGPPLPEFLHIYWPWYKPPGAEFQVSNLIISPAEVQLGYSVTISCLVENIGTEVGTKTVVCKVEGEIMAEQSVTLEPGESRTIAFEVVPDVAKTYSVSVDGLSGTFRATTVPVADIRVENLVIEPSEVQVGQPVTISVMVANYGAAAGSKTISCNIT